MGVDWPEVELTLRTKEGGDPEGIVHELAHMYDCVGKSAFLHVGTQNMVGDVLRGKFKTKRSRNLAEMRASAITYKVLVALKYPDERKTILRSMLDNMEGLPLSPETRERYELRFEAYVSKSPRVSSVVRAIVKFLGEYEVTE